MVRRFLCIIYSGTGKLHIGTDFYAWHWSIAENVGLSSPKRDAARNIRIRPGEHLPIMLRISPNLIEHEMNFISRLLIAGGFLKLSWTGVQGSRVEAKNISMLNAEFQTDTAPKSSA